MGGYLQWPKSQYHKTQVIFLILIVFWSGLHVLGQSLRNESDLQYPNEFCGVVSQYGFVEVRAKGGDDTWRITVRTKQHNRKIFKVAPTYLHKPMQKEGVKRGDNICVYYVPTSKISIFENNFIVQIVIDGRSLLEPNKVLSMYMMKVSSLYLYIFFLAIPLILVYVIKFNNS